MINRIIVILNFLKLEVVRRKHAGDIGDRSITCGVVSKCQLDSTLRKTSLILTRLYVFLLLSVYLYFHMIVTEVYLYVAASVDWIGSFKVLYPSP